jgi:hypothetical protein
MGAFWAAAAAAELIAFEAAAPSAWLLLFAF